MLRLLLQQIDQLRLAGAAIEAKIMAVAKTDITIGIETRMRVVIGLRCPDGRRRGRRNRHHSLCRRADFRTVWMAAFQLLSRSRLVL